MPDPDAQNLNPYASPAIVAGDAVAGDVAVAAVRRIEPQFGLEGAIRAEGVLTPRDYRRAIRLVYAPVRRLSVPLSLAVVLWMFWRYGKSWTETAVMGTFFCAIVVLSSVNKRRQLNRRWQQRVGSFRPVCHLIAPSGVASCTDLGTNVIRWEALSKATRLNSLAVLHYREQNWVMPLPRSHFASEADWQRFLDLLKEKLPIY